ncbi:hypothetical protein EPI10_016240 [Gossypium australe]|uniref:Reverse transcriptase n=1 Tax=Gossypium australe TaxID=47621 RepID=A0A5B6VN11_9ROSI|nr:hypothetical protein EPI10_016240 [Gossypium australe]
MEVFLRILIHAQNNNVLRGIRASINGPRINHLFFADDALLFVRNKKRNEGQSDRFVWFHNPNGCFTSKLAYSWLLLKEIGFGPHSCVDWLENIMRILDKRAMADLITILWNCWNSGNNFIFKGKEDKARTIWDRASNLGKEFRIYNLLNAPMLSQNMVIKKWEKPPRGFEAKCIAFERSIELAGQLNINDDALFETDHAGLVNIMNSDNTDVTIIGDRIKACRDAFNNFKSAKLIWSNQSCNNVTDFIYRQYKLLCELKGIIGDAIYEKLYELYAKKCKQKALALSECTFALQRVLKKMSSIVPSTRDANMHPYLEYLTQCMVSLGPVVMHYVSQHGLDIIYRPQLPLSWHSPTSMDPCTPPLSVFSEVSPSIPVPQGSANTRLQSKGFVIRDPMDHPQLSLQSSIRTLGKVKRILLLWRAKIVMAIQI